MIELDELGDRHDHGHGRHRRGGGGREQETSEQSAASPERRGRWFHRVPPRGAMGERLVRIVERRAGATAWAMPHPTCALTHTSARPGAGVWNCARALRKRRGQDSRRRADDARRPRRVRCAVSGSRCCATSAPPGNRSRVEGRATLFGTEAQRRSLPQALKNGPLDSADRHIVA